MTNRLKEFQAHRTRMNNRIADLNHLGIKRFFNLDTTAYQDNVLDSKTKELLGFVASMVLPATIALIIILSNAWMKIGLPKNLPKQ